MTENRRAPRILGKFPRWPPTAPTALAGHDAAAAIAHTECPPMPLVERDLLCAGEQQAERDRLRKAIGKLLIGGEREQQVAPIGGESRESGTSSAELLGNLVTKEPTEAGGHLGELLGPSRRDWMPPQAIVEYATQRFWRGAHARPSLDRGAVYRHELQTSV